MLKTLYRISTYLIILLGIAHILFTIPNYGWRWTLNAMWFMSAGFAIVFAGFLNLAVLRGAGADRIIRLLCLISNVILALLFGAAVSLLNQPQVYLGTFLFAFESFAAMMLGRGARR
jgi:hypothetical protein